MGFKIKGFGGKGGFYRINGMMDSLWNIEFMIKVNSVRKIVGNVLEKIKIYI